MDGIYLQISGRFKLKAVRLGFIKPIASPSKSLYPLIAVIYR